MAHQVTFEIPSRPVGIADIVFAVRKNGKKFGELRVSQGTVVWIPGMKTKGHRLGWSELDELFRECGKPVRVWF